MYSICSIDINELYIRVTMVCLILIILIFECIVAPLSLYNCNTIFTGKALSAT